MGPDLVKLISILYIVVVSVSQIWSALKWHKVGFLTIITLNNTPVIFGFAVFIYLFLLFGAVYFLLKK